MDGYGKQMPAGEELGGGDAGAGDGAQAQPIQIPADKLPPGIKEGDCLRCTSMDESGCTFTLEAGEGGGAGKPEEGTPWEDDFRQEMSSRNPDPQAP